MKRSDLLLYLVTDSKLSYGRDLAGIVDEAVRGGVTMVQLREKDASTRDFLAMAKRLKELLAPSKVPLIINDRVDIALACGADGVHLGQSDMPCGEARLLMGPDAIIGLSAESLEDVVAANGMDVDYVGISPVFSTSTKTDTAAPFGLEGLKKARALSVHPLVAIGGMNIDTAAQAMEAGADGIAVVSAIVSAPDPFEAAAVLKKKISE